MVTQILNYCYLPVVVHSLHHSALDALVALNVPRDEAMDLFVAHWHEADLAILANVYGGRCVVAVPLSEGRWAAGNAYQEHASVTPSVVERNLWCLLKRGRKGLVARVAVVACDKSFSV